MLNNPKLDFVSINACANFGQNSFIHSFILKILSGYEILVLLNQGL